MQQSTLAHAVGFVVALAASSVARAKPDLVPTDAYLVYNQLQITIENQGADDLPWSQFLHARVYVDGRERKRLYLQPYGSMLQAGESLTIATGLRLGGSPKHVLVVVDPDDILDEESEIQNELSQLVEPMHSNNPDLVISDIGAGRTGMRFTFTNQNLGYTPDGLAMSLTFSVNRLNHQTHTFLLPQLAAGQSYNFYLFNTTVSPGDDISASFSYSSYPYFGEADTQNNQTRWTVPPESWQAKYEQLFADPSINAALYWAGSAWEGPYSSWPVAAKDQLFELLELLESGQDLPLSGLPHVTNPDSNGLGYISEADAWLIYLAHVAHSLWFDASGLVPWRIGNLVEESKRLLLDSRRLFSYVGGAFRFNTAHASTVTIWNPQISYRFLTMLGLVKESELDSIIALSDWMRINLRHRADGDGPREELYGYGGLPPVDRMLYPPRGEDHVSLGCQWTTGLYSGVLRTLNIPVQRADADIFTGAHERPAFVSTALTLGHGDDPYSQFFLPTGNWSPIDGILYPDNHTRGPTWPEPGELDCNASVCNRQQEQAAYNLLKDQWAIAIDNLTDYPLWLVAKYGWQRLTDELVGDYALPYYDAYDRWMIMIRIINEFDRIGEGDVNLGAARVLDRVDRFWANQ